MASTGSAIGSFYAINEDRANAGRYGGADYAAIVILSAIPSSDDIRRLEGYYRDKFATLKLPQIHPYVTTIPYVGDTPTDSAVTSHRYGRFRCVSTVALDNFAGITELELYETIGGSNVASGATYTSGAAPSSGALTDLKDGNLSTTQAQWSDKVFDVQVDFGSGNSKAINQIGFAPNKDFTTRSPRWFAWDVSDDGSTWTTSWVGKYTGSFTVGTLLKFSASSI